MPSTKRDWLIPASLIVLSLVPAIAGTGRMLQLTDAANATPENARFFAMPVPVLLHIPSVILYSMLGALQFSPGFRRQNRRWHKVAGRVLLPSALLVAVSGLWMTLAYPWPAGDGVGVYVERLMVGSWMLLAIVAGTDAIRRRKYVEHGEWMIRAYAIGMGAGTQVFTHLPWFILVDRAPGELPRTVMMGLAWVINAVFAEWVIRRQRIDSAAATRRIGGRRRDPGVVRAPALPSRDVHAPDSLRPLARPLARI